MMRVFMVMLCSLMAVCSVSARISRREGMDGQAAIYRLPLFERAVCCTKYFEGWHSEKHHPYVGWGHKILPDERYSARTMTKRRTCFCGKTCGSSARCSGSSGKTAFYSPRLPTTWVHTGFWVARQSPKAP